MASVEASVPLLDSYKGRRRSNYTALYLQLAFLLVNCPLIRNQSSHNGSNCSSESLSEPATNNSYACDEGL